MCVCPCTIGIIITITITTIIIAISSFLLFYHSFINLLFYFPSYRYTFQPLHKSLHPLSLISPLLIVLLIFSSISLPSPPLSYSLILLIPVIEPNHHTTLHILKSLKLLTLLYCSLHLPCHYLFVLFLIITKIYLCESHQIEVCSHKDKNIILFTNHTNHTNYTNHIILNTLTHLSK